MAQTKAHQSTTDVRRRSSGEEAGDPIDVTSRTSASSSTPAQHSRWDEQLELGTPQTVLNIVAETADRLFVGGIPARYTEEQVLDVLSEIGCVASFLSLSFDCVFVCLFVFLLRILMVSSLLCSSICFALIVR